MIKVSGVPYFLCRHFRILEDLPDVQYSENIAIENARLLMEGSLDVALIPVYEFAADGGYIGLDFGVASYEKSEILYLCSNCPAESLEKVYAYQDSSASSLLFKIMVKQKWNNNPRLVKSRFKRKAEEVGPKEGILARYEGPATDFENFEYRYDLGKEWYNLTGKPHIYLIWAARPGVLSSKELRMLHDTMHKGVKACGKIARANAEVFDCSPEETERFIEGNFCFKFDDQVLEGLTKQLQLTSEHNLTPEVDYNHAFISLLEQEPCGLAKLHEEDVLHTLLHGKRLSIRDTHTLFESNNIAQIAAVASTRSAKVNPGVSLRLKLSTSELEDILIDKPLIKDLNSRALDRICIDSESIAEELDYYEDLIVRTSKILTCKLECFSTGSLIKKIRAEDKSVSKTAARLAACGLSSVGPDSEMPYTQISSERFGVSVDEVLRIHKWLHSYNISTYCCVPGNEALSLKELVSHLYQLRYLQDFTRGSSWLVLEPFKNRNVSIDLKFIKRSAIAALFMDNITTTAIYLRDTSELASSIQLASFVNEIFIDTSLNSLESSNEIRDYFSSFIEQEVAPRVLTA
ncbi:MAG: MqnA/MqnD/SBP family protein [Bdellovibrionota bacterium]